MTPTPTRDDLKTHLEGQTDDSRPVPTPGPLPTSEDMERVLRASQGRLNQDQGRIVICPYCEAAAILVDSSEVYRRSYGMIWICRPCQAWVGVHRDSKNHQPLGRLANAELRKWKQRAHAAFDPLWQGKIRRDGCSKSKARVAGYKWLATQLGIRYRDCHVGMFDIDLCQRTVEVCAALNA